MNKAATPWYVRILIGLAAWITAIVLTLLAGTTVFGLIDIEDLSVLAFFGAIYLGGGIVLLRKSGENIFREQLGLAAALAGAATVSIALSVELDSLWWGLLIACVVLGIVEATSKDFILRFMVTVIVAGFYMSSLYVENVRYAIGLAALTTPLGLYLLFRLQTRDLTPVAVAFVLAFPLASILLTDVGIMFQAEPVSGIYLAKSIHIVLFLYLLVGNSIRRTNQKAKYTLAGFLLVATLICLLLPPGGSAAMLILTLAYVMGSVPFAILGIVIQAQFIVRFYYWLEMNLLDKSLLLLGVGSVLLIFWYLIDRGVSRERTT